MTGSKFLNTVEHELLDAMLDQIIPASSDGRIPAAGALGIATFIENRIDADPDLQECFRHGLTVVGEMMKGEEQGLDPEALRTMLNRLEEQEPAFFEALLRETYMGYYSRSDIRRLFGLSPKPTHPDGYDVPPDDPDELAALLEPVKNRGRCYREA